MKYKLLKNDYTDVSHPVTKKPVRLYRVLALKTFTTKIGEISEGTIGGFIADESNLNQNDSSWLYNMSKIFDNALLIDSVLLDYALVYQNAIVQDSICRLYARVFGDVTIIESEISNNVSVSGKGKIERSKLFEYARVSGNVLVDRCIVHDGVVIRDASKVCNCVLRDTTMISGVSDIENCQYSGHTIIHNTVAKNETRTTDVPLEVIQNIFEEGKSAFK